MSRLDESYGCGYSITSWVPNRVNTETGKLELNAPLGNYIGPGTDVQKRVAEHVEPTTETDFNAMTHDIEYNNIGSELATKKITKKQAIQKVKSSDNKLIKRALKNQITINPVEKAHSTLAVSGIVGKKVLQAVGVMDPLAFITVKEKKILPVPKGGSLPKVKIPKKTPAENLIDMVKQKKSFEEKLGGLSEKQLKQMIDTLQSTQ